MSLRKLTTLLLLTAFAFTQVPAQAASLKTGNTLPNVIVDSGTSANGANRDVVPVTIEIDIAGGESVYTLFSGNGNTHVASIDEQGALMIPGAPGQVGDTRLIILTPPTNTEFVGLSGYNGNISLEIENGGGASANSFVNVTALADAQMPTDVPSTDGESAILAKIIGEAGTLSSLGVSGIPAGSIVIYPISFQTGTSSNPIPADIVLENIGLAVDPEFNTSSALELTYVAPTQAGFNESVATLADGATLTIATSDADANGQIAVALDSTEPDAQANTALADFLTSASSTVSINTNNTTSTSSNQSVLYVDTDTLLIQAGETPTSTTGSPDYYDTPFNTSALNLAGVVNGNDASLFGTALTSSSLYPNQDALITVTYSVVPLSGSGTTDASITVNAASVSLMDNGSSEGYLGAEAIAPTIANGATALTNTNEFGLAVLYNGADTTGPSAVLDFDLLDDSEASIQGQSNVLGFHEVNGTLATANGTQANVVNGTLTTGIFPGVNGADFADNTGGTTFTSAGAIAPFTVAPTFNGSDDEIVWVQDEVTARLLPTGGSAIFVLTGNEAGDDMGTQEVNIAPTNLSSISYGQGAVLQADDGDLDVQHNAVLAASLSGAVVSIMPLINKVDSTRDVIKVRPEITVTLGTTSRTEGVKVIATVTGNNIAGSKEIEVARVTAAGVADADVTVRTLPVSGDGNNNIMAENGTDAHNNRTTIDLNDIDDDTNNSIATLIGALTTPARVLDDTVPPLYCGGSVGDGTKGPNNVVYQAYARAIMVEENAVGALESAVTTARPVLRFTMPAGVDLIKTDDSTLSNNDFGVISTNDNNGSTAGTIAGANNISAIETIADTGTQAYVDVDLSNPVVDAGTSLIKNAIGLAFGTSSFVVPEGTADTSVTVSIVDDNNTPTNDADDTVLDVLGTATLGTCTSQLEVSYCDDALSNFGLGSGPVESVAIANGGSLMSSFSAPGSTIRLVNTDTTDFELPDICVTELEGGAFPLGAPATTPNMVPAGDAHVVLGLSATRDGASTDVGFNTTLPTTSGGTLPTSDATFTADATTGSAGHGAPFAELFAVELNAGTGDVMGTSSEFRISGLNLEKSASLFVPAAQDLAAFIYDDNISAVVGSTFPLSILKDGTNGTAYLPEQDGTTAQRLAGTFFNGDNFAASTATDDVDFTNTANAGLAFAQSNAGKITGLTSNVNDNATDYPLIDSDTEISVSVEDVAAVANGLAAYTKVTVFTSTGELVPGAMITVASPDDNVTVPVDDQGNFTAMLRADQGDTLTITQLPLSTRGAAVVSVTADDQNLDPTLLSAVATSMPTIGNITAQGTAPVLFTLTSVGQLDGSTFQPTADQLSVTGGGPVYAVPGTTNQFIAIVDIGGSVSVTANVTGQPSVAITGLTTQFATRPRRTRPVLKSAVQRTRKKDSTERVVLKGNRLRKVGQAFFVGEDGTVTALDLRDPTQKDRQRRRRVSDGVATIPTGTAFAVFHVPGRGISTIDISGN